MSRRRRVELISGLGAGILGVLVLVFIVIDTSTEQQFEVATVIFFIAVFLGFAGVAAGAYLHAQRQVGVGLILLWVGVALLIGCMILSLLTVGCFLFPVTLLSLVSAMAGSSRQTEGDTGR